MDGIRSFFFPVKLEDQVFTLKFTASQIEREARKCKSEEAKEKKRVVQALKENRVEVAQTYAENAVRNRNQYNKLTALSAKVDAIRSRVQQADQTLKITKSIGQVSKELEKASKLLDLEKMSRLMDKFEKEFDTIDVKTTTLDNGMGNTTATMAPTDDVNMLLKQLADEANIELNQDMPEANGTANFHVPNTQEQNKLSDILAEHRNI